MSPLAGYTGFRSSMDDIAGTFGNMGASLGNMVNTLFSGLKINPILLRFSCKTNGMKKCSRIFSSKIGTFGAVGGLIDSWFGMGVMNRLNSPTYITQST